MRYTLWTLCLALLATSLIACDPGTDDTIDPELTASAEEAIEFVDGELAAEGMERDLSILDNDRLIEEVRRIAEFAEAHGCDVGGALGGIYLPDPDVDGGTFNGRWIKRDLSLGGDLDGSYTPDLTDPAEEVAPGEIEPAGTFEGDWEAADGQYGVLGGEYYRFEEGRGAFLGRYAATDSNAHGMLGGLWYDLEREGGVFFGVWGHCGDDAVKIEPESY